MKFRILKYMLLDLSFLTVIIFLSNKPLNIPKLFRSYPRIIKVKEDPLKDINYSHKPDL